MRVANIGVKTAAALLGVAGIACVASAATVPHLWIARHFLPDFAISPTGRLFREVLGRSVIALAGAALIREAARLPFLPMTDVRRKVDSLAPIALAVMLAIGAAEGMLALLFPRVFQPLTIGQEPLRVPDTTLGWVNAPSRTIAVNVAGRTVVYATDAAGNRVAPDTLPQHGGPTVVFSGESYIFGYKLPWEETIPARVAALTGLNVVNLGVAAYSHEQAYLRLTDAFARIDEPRAVVSIFLPLIFRKDLDHTRPWLDASLAWHAPTRRLRTALLARWLFPYASASDIARGAETVRATLRASSALARSRGAQHIIVVPRTSPEPLEERILRETVLDRAGLPYVLVDLDPAWHVAGDRHPDARGAEAIAKAVADVLSTFDAGTR